MAVFWEYSQQPKKAISTMTALSNSTALSTAAATFGDDMKAFRSSAVTAENKGNVAARSLLAALVAGIYTPALASAAIIHAFGNPKSPKTGKPVDKLSGLRNFNGGDAARKMAETVYRIFDNIDADKVSPDGADDYAPTIRPLVVGFILSNDDAPKSLRALVDAVNSALRAYAKATQPDNADAAAENGGDNAAPDAPAASQSLSDRTLALMVAYEAATVEERHAAHDALSALFDMVNADVEAETVEAVAAA